MTTQLKGMDGAAVEISTEALQSFKAAFKGAVLGPEDAAYEETRKIWNAMIDRRPGLIVRCTGTVDVVQAVHFAREHRVLLSVRGGGHNIAGLAVCEGGLMIDLSLLRGVWVDAQERTARAQAGCTLGDVDRETQLHGLAAVLGFVSVTGIAGLTVGGGMGYLTRRYGWTCDTVLSMEVVTADAKVVRASAQENADLFWALRGGGGNFGIVTSFEYQLFPVGAEILSGAAAPRELTSVAALRIAPPAPWLPKETTAEASKTAKPCWRRCARQAIRSPPARRRAGRTCPRHRRPRRPGRAMRCDGKWKGFLRSRYVSRKSYSVDFRPRRTGPAARRYLSVRTRRRPAAPRCAPPAAADPGARPGAGHPS